MPEKKPSPKSTTSKKVKGNSKEQVTSAERDKMIAEAAYYRAEQHGFNPESVQDDWYEAEKTVDTMLNKGAAKETAKASDKATA